LLLLLLLLWLVTCCCASYCRLSAAKCPVRLLVLQQCTDKHAQHNYIEDRCSSINCSCDHDGIRLQCHYLLVNFCRQSEHVPYVIKLLKSATAYLQPVCLTVQVCCVAAFFWPLVQQQAVGPNLQQLLPQLLAGCSSSNTKWHQCH
jgi:hypothetical protein